MKKTSLFFIIYLCAILSTQLMAQTESISRKWNNIVLEGIRNDFARPTIHARNLYHHSVICYDAWAIFNPTSPTVFLGQTFHGYPVTFNGISLPQNKEEAREIAISYASYRFIENRYSNSPDYQQTLLLANNLMADLGLDPIFTSVDYQQHGAAALGNYLAQQIQLYGYTDGSNEVNDFDNVNYIQLNPPLDMSQPGNPSIQDPNHWQPLSLETSIDQSGNLISSIQPHLSPEWGAVTPFSLKSNMISTLNRDSVDFDVYFDSLQPAYLSVGDSLAWNSFYKWNHTLVSVWQSHLDTSDGVVWDISPASIGNNLWYPSDSTEYTAFYDLTNGGDPSVGYAINPITGLPYVPQNVLRADYARVLAEFWADGIDSETPPGHWFEIYHYVSDQPSFERKWKGIGPELDALEYDVKAHLTLGGTMHDAAISAWSLKGYHDYLRPVSAIRFMADQGQSSDTSALNYHPDGIPLLPGFVEIVEVGDTLAGQWNENVGKIKLFTWRGHDFITSPAIDFAGVGWILAENWWPYQRPTFVTPPFAGFVSGHSTFSRAAAHTLEFVTGSPFFPGGLGEFVAPKNEFLKFEIGPSDTIVLQWATYRDASDQCSLSRIWGGIHPPIDDIPGRMIGDVVGSMAAEYADSLFSQFQPGLLSSSCSDTLINTSDIGSVFTTDFSFNTSMDTSYIPSIVFITPLLDLSLSITEIYWLDSFNLQATFSVLSSASTFLQTKFELSNLQTSDGANLPNYSFSNYFIIDTKRPQISSVSPDILLLNDNAMISELNINVVFDELCDTTSSVFASFQSPSLLNTTFVQNVSTSGWLNDTTYLLNYSIIDYNETIDVIDAEFIGGIDVHGNPMPLSFQNSLLAIDTENPALTSVSFTDTLINTNSLMNPQTSLLMSFSEAMETTIIPNISFLSQGTAYTSLQQDLSLTSWINSQTLYVPFTIFNNTNNLMALDMLVQNLKDLSSNNITDSILFNVVWSDMKEPEIAMIDANSSVVNDSLIGASNYYIDLLFDEPMDTTVIPSVLHFAAQNIGGSVQYNVPQSTFLDSFSFRAYFQVIDQNVEIAPVNLQVDFGQDASGNKMNYFIEDSFTVIDTKNPEVQGLYTNTSILNENGQTWELLALYNEPMSVNVSPSISLPVLPFNLLQINSVWISPTSFEALYELSGSSYQGYTIDVLLNSAVDLAGNEQVDFEVSDFLNIHPFLALNSFDDIDIILYPNPILSGEKFIISGISGGKNEITLRCFNAYNQETTPLQMKRVGNNYVSANVNLSSGLYFLKYENQQFKLMVR